MILLVARGGEGVEDNGTGNATEDDPRRAESADFYDEIYAGKDYVGEAARVAALVRERNPAAATLLDVACGTGRHLEHFAESFACEGVDINPALLDIARDRCGDMPFTCADMTSFDLGRTFDAVTCLFSAIGYARTAEGLEAAVGTMARHLASDGVLVVEPFVKPEEWITGRVAAETAADDGRRALVRMVASGRVDDIALLDMRYLSGRDGEVEYSREHLEIGLFTFEQYTAAFDAAGLVEITVDTEGLIGRGLVTGLRPAG